MKNRRWTQEEINYLIYCAKHEISRNSCAKLLNRSLDSIYYEISKLGLSVKKKKWTQEETMELKRLLESKTDIRECATKLNRSFNSVKMKISHLGLTTGKNKNWTHKEEKKLHEYLNKNLTYVECAKKLNRSFNSIRSKASIFGFTNPNNKFRKWTQEEIEYLLYCAKNGVNWEECARKLNRTIMAVKRAVYRYKHEIIYKFPNRKKRGNELDMCLNCTMPDCTNCLGGGN